MAKVEFTIGDKRSCGMAAAIPRGLCTKGGRSFFFFFSSLQRSLLAISMPRASSRKTASCQFGPQWRKERQGRTQRNGAEFFMSTLDTLGSDQKEAAK